MFARLATIATVATALGLFDIALSQANQPTSMQPAQIDRNGVLILVRSTLIALQQADETGNYTVLRDLGAPGFARVNTAARLGEIFSNLRAKNIDLAGILVLDPQLTALPQIDNSGMMHMAGFFPSVPLQIKFELAYAPVDGRWRPFGISVGLESSSPEAPNAPQMEPRVTPSKKPEVLKRSETSSETANAEPAKSRRKPHVVKAIERPLQLDQKADHVRHPSEDAPPANASP